MYNIPSLFHIPFLQDTIPNSPIFNSNIGIILFIFKSIVADSNELIQERTGNEPNPVLYSTTQTSVITPTSYFLTPTPKILADSVVL